MPKNESNTVKLDQSDIDTLDIYREQIEQLFTLLLKSMDEPLVDVRPTLEVISERVDQVFDHIDKKQASTGAEQ